MSQPSSFSFTFRALFDAALHFYKVKTGTSLFDHPFAKQLETCESVNSITAILREQAQSFREFTENDGKLMKALNSLVDVLCAPFISVTLSEAIGPAPFSPAKAVFAGIGILLTTVKEMRASYDALVDLLASLENFLSRLSIYAGIPPTPALTNVLVKIIVELISTLALATKQVKQGRFKKFTGKLRGEKYIEATIQRLDRLTLDEGRATAAQAFEVVYGLVQHRRAIMDDADGNESASVISHALETMQEIVIKLNQAERDMLQQDVRNWLSPPDPWKNHNIARGSRHSGTGTWWIEGDAYAEWKFSGCSSLLWIHGKPGAGKSVICSAIIDDIRTLQRCGLASLAFFYCDFRDDQKKDLRGLLSSLLVQLGGQSDAYSTVLFDFYVAHGRGSQHASDSELVDCLKDMLNHPGQATVHIAIDALNECPLTTDFPPPREKVLELVDELVNWHLPNLRICVTSRPEADIVPILEPLASCSVSLHGESGQVQDIAEYVRFFVHTNREMKRWSSTNKQLVIDELTNKADGMFHWVICQLVYLSRCIPGRIRHALNELPRTLDATYARTLQEIDEQNWYYAHRLFQCVAATSRPLRAEELAEFLAFDFEAGSTPKFMADWRSEDPQNAVLSICSTLLVVVKPHLGSPVIQFAHFSVKEYLTSTRLAEAKDTISRFYVSMTPAHAIVAQACLGVLLHLDENITEDSLKDFPLAEYAAEHWVDHARFEGVPPIAEDGMKQLFDPSKPHLAICVWIYDPAVPTWKRLTRNKTPLPPPRSSLHHAAFWGLHPVVEFLIIEHSQDVCSRDSTDNSAPLHLASRNGYVETVYKLIEHSADPTAQNKDGETPLHLALEEGEVEVARMLIERGADPTAKNNYGETPLHLASQMGQVYITRMLIERGADLTAQKNNGWTPLHAALDGGHQSVALLLLERGAEIGCLDSQSRTPLHIACRGCTDVVSVLIDRGVDLNAEDDSRETPLHVASQWGHDDIIRLLLDHDADADRLDDGGWAPLHVASHEGHDKIVQLLFDAGADANRPDNGGWTPLHLTSWEGHEQIVRLLLDHGINANHPDNGGWNPLHAASQEGHNHIVELLLDHGADPHHANSDGSTSLHIALQKNRHYIVQLLLDHGADPNYPNSDGSTLLHLASQRGQDNTVRLLLHHGAFANRLNGDGWASLHLASQRGHYDVVELLLEHGADSNHAHSNGLTPLHLASQEGHDHVVRLLLDHGADANSLNSDGGTPLHLALQKGHDRIVQLLLEHDADADHPNDDSLTPMGFGSREGGAKWKRLASATRKRRRM